MKNSQSLFQSSFLFKSDYSTPKVLSKEVKDAELVLSELKRENHKKKKPNMLRMSCIQPEHLLKRVGVLALNQGNVKENVESSNYKRSDVEKFLKTVDSNSNGLELGYKKYSELFKDYNFHITQEEFNLLSDDGRTVSLDALSEFVEQLDENNFDLIKELFTDLTGEGSESLNAELIEDSMKHFGLYWMNKYDHDSVFQFMDLDKDGQISLNDFRELCKQLNEN